MNTNGNFRDHLSSIIAGDDLNQSEMYQMMDTILSGEVTDFTQGNDIITLTALSAGPSNGVLLSDAHFSLILGDGKIYDVTVKAAWTNGDPEYGEDTNQKSFAFLHVCFWAKNEFS